MTLSIWLTLLVTGAVAFAAGRVLGQRHPLVNHGPTDAGSDQGVCCTAILDSLDTRVAVLDATGRIIETNQNWKQFDLQIDGHPTSQIGDNFLAFCDSVPAERFKAAQDIARGLRRVSSRDAELEIIRYCRSSANEIQAFRTHITPLGSEQIIGGTVVALTNCSQQWQLEEEAKLLSLVARHTDNGVMILDQQRNCSWINEGFSRITGYSLEELGGQRLRFQFHGPNTDRRTLQVMQDGLENGTGYTVEVQLHNRQGDAYWVAMEAKPIHKNGEINGFIIVASETTARRNAERELRDERALLRQILARIPFHIYWKAADSSYMGCNQAFADSMGLEHPELIKGRTDADLRALDATHGKHTEADDAVLRTGKPQLQVAQEQQDADGNPVYLSASRVPMFNEARETIGMIGVTVDVTEKKELEERLTQFNILEAIGQLSSGIAHEINTPIQYVGDNTLFLSDSVDDMMGALSKITPLLDAFAGDERYRELTQQLTESMHDVDLEFLQTELPVAIEQTLQGVGHVRKIVASMKEFSHPGGDEKTVADVNSALENTIVVTTNEWRYVAEMDTDLAPDLPPIPCLIGELNQVFLNIIVNAAHALDEMDDRSELGRIGIKTRLDGDYVRIEISDTGPGMTDELKKKIFDPFFTTKGVGKGTGQGLSIARNIILTRHGGQIEVLSQLGRGTTFVIRLPLSDTVAVAAVA
ncbi:MAG: PAS domain S-box protein [Gammaproteobacteria bacterium]